MAAIGCLIKNMRYTWLKIVNNDLHLYGSHNKTQERKNRNILLRIWRSNEKVNYNEIEQLEQEYLL